MLNPSLLWLIAGSILCLLELIFPTAFVALMMGISAIIVAITSPIMPHLGLQVFLWLSLSTLLIWLSHRLMPKKRTHSRLSDAQEGETLTEIAPGKTGRVIYEGNSWQAKCEDEQIAIPAQEKVYIVSREGNTLIVLPANLI